ncbi:MAG: putative 2-aminoethylphosphonate ABC transporter ATP-binding protein [Burkholderiaceae bacterium]|nr:putative 2-aminoethylphosphonate ABC transporter ATP-binding protein [Burkholderiaceae bacterium]
MTLPQQIPNEALRLEGVGKSFGAFVALRDVDLSIKRGEFVCFLGPSGCGKTTLLRIIAGLEQQTAGRIVQNGRDVSNLPPAGRDYGIVFQSYALFPNLTVEQNVGYGLVNRKHGRAQVRQRVDELLTLVGLPGTGSKYPSQCSGGQQQRIALARALAASPGLLLLDEPLSALDAKVRERLRGELRGLQRKLGVTTIMVTHDQEEALSLADRVVVMNQGVIEQVGTPLEVYERAASPFVADFLGRINVLQGTSLGDGRFRIGTVELQTSANGIEPGVSAHLYLRPEDRHVEGDASFGADALRGRVSKLDFLGTFCLAEVSDSTLGQPVLLYFSLNQMHDLDVREGGQITFALRGERARVFGAQPPAAAELRAAA